MRKGRKAINQQLAGSDRSSHLVDDSVDNSRKLHMGFALQGLARTDLCAKLKNHGQPDPEIQRQSAHVRYLPRAGGLRAFCQLGDSVAQIASYEAQAAMLC